MHSPDELKALTEVAIRRFAFWPELDGQTESMRYALEMGGKRVRPVICLATGEACSPRRSGSPAPTRRRRSRASLRR